MKIKKILKPMSVALATTMICSNFMIASATEDVLINETPLEDAEDTEFTGLETNYNEVEVTYNQASRYSVSIPKTIALNTSKQASYAIKVTGDIDANECVYVAPVDSIVDTSDIDFYMKDENSLKPDVVATVDQNKFYWSSIEVADGYEETNNSISAPNLTSGSWKGTFQVEIRLETSHEHDYSNGKCSICGRIDPDHTHTYENGVCTECGEKESVSTEQLEAGLYTASGVLFRSWEESGIDNTCSNAATILKNYPTVTKIVLPNTVAYISENAFNSTKLTSVVISSPVTSIGNQAFSNCTSLVDVVIPDSVIIIGSHAFYRCTSLSSVRIPDSVISIDASAFDGCTSLKNAIIGNSVKNIGNAAFGTCKALTAINIPNSVTEIGNQAFGNCTSLESITIPDSVTNLGGGAFYNCTALASVTIGNSITSLDCLKSSYSSYGMFQGCTSLTDVTIGDSVTSIGDLAFNGCTSLVRIEIPNSVITIGGNAFSNCTSLVDVEISNSVITIGGNAFYGCTLLSDVTIPDSVTTIGSNAFKDVPHIIYNGTASGSPWGAKSVN